MSINFKENTANPNTFFDILPKDWQEDIVPFWANYKNDTKIYVLEEDSNVIGGGMVFSTLSPDLQNVPQIAASYYKKKLLYLAFIWINESHRSKGLGSFWLNQLIQQNPKQGYWLTIDDFSLKHFYENIGFKLSESYFNNGNEEWVMVLGN